ncbi:MAG: 2-amino-4-hydroxy-6-hydroxymethyldihydropteridine diphosphokinase [Elusimicrobia bacterium]|nr:2-amino-4-hydroxy-6-hydroxymethyldihydropteridine diphosphokinase [Elusimicrobiota bacterium]
MKAFLALGSNLGDRLGNIEEALRLLRRCCRLVKISSIYETPPMYYTRQGDFYNAAVEIETGMAPLALLRETRAIEKALKRRRRFRNSPRTMDVDVLFYEGKIIKSPALAVPHPKLAERPFVLAPLCEIATRLRHPVSGLSVHAMLRACPGAAGGARRLPADYKEALDYLNELAPCGSFSTAPVRAALEKLGRPQDGFYAVHVAGTNGKGSVAAMVAGALSRCGHRTGLYLSPHINGPRERISLDGRNISEADFFRLFCAVKSFGFELSYFEYLTVLAFLWFRERRARFAVVEAGLGGRLDATNVFKSSLAVITNVSLEHAAALGGSLESIAAHKAGIIKAGCPVAASVSGAALSVIRRRAAAAGSRLYPCGPDERFYAKGADIFYRWGGTSSRPLKLSLKGSYQLVNAGLAMKVLEVLRKEDFHVPAGTAAAGLAAARLEGRFEIMKAAGINIILDGAHNPEAMSALFASLRAAGFSRPVTLAAIMRDKAAGKLIGIMGRGSRAVVFSAVVSPRVRRPGELARIGRVAGYKVHYKNNAGAAFTLARRLALESGAPLLVTGSFYLVAEIKAAMKKAAPPVFPQELLPAKGRPLSGIQYPVKV